MTQSEQGHDRQKLIQRLRRALTLAHADDWSTEIISEAALICASVILPKDSRPTHPLKGDTPEKARIRWAKGGFGVAGSREARAAFARYMTLFSPEVKL